MAPKSQTAAGGNRAGAELTVVEDPANSAFKCKFCDRKFTSKIGVGVHMSNVHKLDANDLIMTERVKSRWSDEEKRLLALSEAKLVFGGVPSCGINRELTLKIQGHTLEAIKGRRRTQEHHDRVAVFLADLQGNLRAPVAERVTTVPETNEARTEQVDDDGAEAVGDRVGTLDHLSAAESRARKAVEFLSTVSGVDSRAGMPRASEMLKYWVPLFIEGKITDNSQPQSPVPSQEENRFVTVLEPITPEKVEASLPCVKAAPGPDGFPTRLWRRLPCNLIAGIFNMFSATGSLPTQLVRSRRVTLEVPGQLSANFDCVDSHSALSSRSSQALGETVLSGLAATCVPMRGRRGGKSFPSRRHTEGRLLVREGAVSGVARFVEGV
ncbi:hypothetical protein QTP88_003818 [Uroleucon formosanum]